MYPFKRVIHPHNIAPLPKPRYHVHFTPTGASWLNQIERWFAEITRRRIRRGTFSSAYAAAREINAEIYSSVESGKTFGRTWNAVIKVLKTHVEVGAMDTEVRETVYINLLWVFEATDAQAAKTLHEIYAVEV